MLTKQTVVLGLLLGPVLSFADTRPDFQQNLQTIRAVGPEGQGNAAASQAWTKLASGNRDDLLPLLAGMDEANDLAINWLRTVVETIASRERPETLPFAELGQFLFETRHHPRARRLAFELIARADPQSTQKLLPGLLNDPSSELRRDAVQQLMDQAALSFGGGNKPGATLLYQQALVFAREAEQTESIAKKLKELGHPVDLAKQFAFVMHWKVIGPFDNTGGEGFAAVFPPERKIDLNARYDGKTNAVQWQDFTTKDSYGRVDVNKPCGALKGVTAYAYTELDSPLTQPAELRLACKNGWKIWFNGQFIIGRDEYHRMTEIDQYRLPVTLQAGRNQILVKVCQNEQVEDWTKEWEFQLRITDALGTPVSVAVIDPTTTSHFDAQGKP